MAGASGASVRLFCLPGAGETASVYLSWAAEVGPAVVVAPVELPGRGARARERRPDALEPLLKDLVPTVARRCDRPFALFGHGLGALLAYELAARLEREHGLTAERLYVAEQPAPRTLGRERVAHQPDAAYLAALARGRYAKPYEAFVELMAAEAAAAARHADLALAKSYRWDPEAVVHCPVTVLHNGLGEPATTGPDLTGWQACTQRPLRVRSLPGGRSFPHTSRRELFDVFAEDLTYRELAASAA